MPSPRPPATLAAVTPDLPKGSYPVAAVRVRRRRPRRRLGWFSLR